MRLLRLLRPEPLRVLPLRRVLQLEPPLPGLPALLPLRPLLLVPPLAALGLLGCRRS
jgi:hypothetical protein